MLTVERLKEMQPGIFDGGIVTLQELGGTVRWVAVRGGIHDWAIYYGNPENSIQFIKSEGMKVYEESVIKKLVICDQQAFEMYRH